MEFKKNKFLLVEAVANQGDKLNLYFNLIDMDIVDRWIALVDKNNELKHSLRYNYRRILTEDEVNVLFAEFLNNIEYINNNYDRKLISSDSLDNLRKNENILNDLHEEFEIYGNRLEHLIGKRYFDDPRSNSEYDPIWPGDIHNKILHESFLLLNEQIHNLEAIFDYRNCYDNALCSCNIDFMPADLHDDLKPEDYFLFDCYDEWGWIYLGYNTLGKHYFSACVDNDIDTVLENRIKPQRRFAAEMYINFIAVQNFYESRVNFYNWWMKNNFSRTIDPQIKINDLALGFIPMGKLNSYRINGNDHTDITPNLDKFNWNKTVWSRFNEIVSAKIIGNLNE